MEILKICLLLANLLTPKMDKGPEKYAKEKTAEGKTLLYKTTWENHPANGEIVNFAKSVTVEISDKNGELPKKNYPFENLPAPSESTDNIVLHLNELGEGMISKTLWSRFVIC